MFTLSVITPLKKTFEGEVEYLQALGTDGLFGVLSHHAPIIAALKFGSLRVRLPDGKETVFCVGDGLFEMFANHAHVMVNTAEAAGEIDVARAEAARDRAGKRLSEKSPDTDLDRARAALYRALTRLQVAGRT
ncbi:MAG: ATP synthase F1 subunit epsilon [bacterium]